MGLNECPNCRESETVVNDLDQSICCSNCGTVVETSNPVQEDHQHQEEPIKSSKRRKERGKELKTWWHQVATFYNMGEELIMEGNRAIDRYYDSLPFQRLYLKEMCVGLVCAIGKAVRPYWMCQDYIEAFPLTLVSSVVMRSYKVFEGDNVEPYSWVQFSDKIIQSILEPVYKPIIEQLYGKQKVPDGFNLLALVSLTKKLFDLGTYQGINGGKKVRPLVVSVACICASQLQLTFDKAGQVAAQKRRRLTKEKNISRSRIHERFLLHRWDFDQLSKPIFSTSKTLRKSFKEYNLMLLACAKKIPWISQDSVMEKTVYTHLDDIIELYSRKLGEYPLMSLSLDEFAPSSFKKNRVKEVVLKSVIERAKKYIEKNERPAITEEGQDEGEDEEERSLVYDVYQCLNAGFTEREIESWTDSEIQNTGELIRFREKFCSHIDLVRNADINQTDIGNNDMNERELKIYIANPPS